VRRQARSAAAGPVQACAGLQHPRAADRRRGGYRGGRMGSPPSVRSLPHHFAVTGVPARV